MNTFKNSLIAKMQPTAELLQKPEPKVRRLEQAVQAFKADLRPVPLLDLEFGKEAASTQNLLKMSNAEATRRLKIRQTKDALTQLHRWENEGGRSDDDSHEFAAQDSGAPAH